MATSNGTFCSASNHVTSERTKRSIGKIAKHRPGFLEPALLERAITRGLAWEKLADPDAQVMLHDQIKLAEHCITLAHAELGSKVLTTDDLLDWTFDLIEQGISELHWCHIADALYSLSLFLVGEVQEDSQMRYLCSKLYKCRHEYQQCLSFIEEQRVRERLGLDSDELMRAVGFRLKSRAEHLRRVSEEQSAGRLASAQ